MVEIMRTIEEAWRPTFRMQSFQFQVADTLIKDFQLDFSSWLDDAMTE